jgi:hypothetical protein
VVYCSGLESQCHNPQESAENAHFCHNCGAQLAMFTQGSADADGAQVGTLTEADWEWVYFSECVGQFDIDRFNRFLGKCGYFSGRKGIPPFFPDYAQIMRESVHDKEWTYFARGRNTGLIKIGRSKQPQFRVSQLKHDKFFGDEADLIGLRKGVVWERAYQNIFHPWRFCGEWFAPHPDILAEIERLKETANA